MKVRVSSMALGLALFCGMASADTFTVASDSSFAGVNVHSDPDDRVDVMHAFAGGDPPFGNLPNQGDHTIVYADGSSENFNVDGAPLSTVTIEEGSQRNAQGQLINGGSNGGGSGDDGGSGNPNPGYGGNNGGWGGGGWQVCGTSWVNGVYLTTCVLT